MALSLRRLGFVFFCLAFVFGLRSSCIAQSFNQSYAVVVGIDSYASLRWRHLLYAKKDAEAMAQYLKSQGYQVTELYNERATRQNILGTFDALERNLGPDDRVLVFFAGHGMNKIIGSEQRGYIVPYDGKDFSSFISYTELQDASELMKAARHQLFIMDACFGGLMMTRSGPPVSPETPNYIKEVTSRITRQVMSAGGGSQEVLDSGPNGHSVFTNALLEGLSGAADLNRDGYITLAELQSYIDPIATNRFQTPAYGLLPGHRGGEYVFLSPRGRAATVVSGPPLPKIVIKRGDSDVLSTAKNLLQANQFAEAIPLLRSSAETENSEAMFFLGLLYSEGRGVAQNYQTAHQWFEKAAAGGQTGAMVQLGYLYSYGYGVKQSALLARQWYEKAAAAGNPDGMAGMGLLYQIGIGVPIDLEQARQWFEKGTMLGGSTAAYSLAVLYAKGEGVQQDFVKARQLCEKAAAAGEPLAAFSLGKLYEQGQGVPQDYVKAREWYEKAVDAGVTDAMNNLGLLYENGQGGEQDYVQARQLYERAVATGSMEAASNLAGMYVRGEGGAQDYEKARDLCKKAAAAGDAMAMYNMGLLYSDGKGVPKDYVQAKQWFEKAAALGIPRAMLSLGLLYASGLGIKEDRVVAKQWFEKAAAAGDKDAADLLKTLFQ